MLGDDQGKCWALFSSLFYMHCEMNKQFFKLVRDFVFVVVRGTVFYLIVDILQQPHDAESIAYNFG